MTDELSFSVPSLGRLMLDRVLESLDGPKIVTFRSDNSGLFLGYWADSDRAREQWLLLPLSGSRFVALADGSVDLRSALSTPEFGGVAILTFTNHSDDDPDARWLLPGDPLLASFLPAAGQFLFQARTVRRESTVEAETLKNELSILKENPETRAALAEIEAETMSEAVALNRDCVTLRFGTPIHEIGIRIVGDVFRALQIAVDSFSRSAFGPVELNLRATAAGSLKLQLVVEGPGQGLLGLSRASVGLTTLFRLMEAGRDFDALEMELERLPRLSAGRYGRLVAAIDRADTTATLCWVSPSAIDRPDSRMAGFSRAGAHLIAGKLQEMEAKQERPYQIEGVLSGFIEKGRRFWLDTKEGPLNGRYDRVVLEEVPHPSIGLRYLATLRETVKIDAAGFEHVDRRMLSLRELPALIE